MKGVKGRETDHREVAPPGQDSCQPGPDMTSSEGEAVRHSQWWGVLGAGIGGQVRGGVSRIAARAWLGCFPPSTPGRCFFLCLLVTHHCISASQNYIFYLSGLSASANLGTIFVSLLLNGLESSRGLYRKVF